MYARILVPLDGSSTAEQALPHAANLAKLYDAEIHLLRVLEPLPPVSGVSPTATRAVKDQVRGWATEYFERLEADLTEQGIPAASHILEGRPGTIITAYAAEHDVDLIVLCSRGRSGVSRWLIGGVADRVMRGTPIPVLLIPANLAGASGRGVGT